MKREPREVLCLKKDTKESQRENQQRNKKEPNDFENYLENFGSCPTQHSAIPKRPKENEKSLKSERKEITKDLCLLDLIFRKLTCVKNTCTTANDLNLLVPGISSVVATKSKKGQTWRACQMPVPKPERRLRITSSACGAPSLLISWTGLDP